MTLGEGSKKKKAKALVFTDNHFNILPVDQLGTPIENEHSTELRRGKNTPTCIVLPTFVSIMRSADCKGVDKSDEQRAAIRLWAEESLANHLEDYVLDYWNPTKETCAVVAVPRAIVQSAREHLKKSNHTLANIIVPELLAPKASGSTFVIWFSDHALMICQWRDQVLREWHVLPYQLGHDRISEILQINSLFGPDNLMLLGEDVTQFDVNTRIQDWGWDSTVETSDDWYSIKDQFQYDLHFDECINETKYLPAEPSQWYRLAAGAAALCVSLTFFAYANLHFLNREAQQLEDEVSKLRISAHRSDEVAFRISESLDRVNAFNALTIERRGAVHIVHAISEKLPDDVRFNTMSISRQGKVVIDGEAKNELGPTVFLTNLGVIDLVDEPKLRFSEQQRQASGSTVSRSSEQGSATKYQIEFNTLAPLLSLPSTEEVL